MAIYLCTVFTLYVIILLPMIYFSFVLYFEMIYKPYYNSWPVYRSLALLNCLCSLFPTFPTPLVRNCIYSNHSGIYLRHCSRSSTGTHFPGSASSCRIVRRPHCPRNRLISLAHRCRRLERAEDLRQIHESISIVL